jgi:hypothetical protein
MEKVKQFNFNSLLTIVCTLLVGFAINRLDGMNTRQIEQAADLKAVKEHIAEIDNKLVTRAELANELAERDRRIDEVRKSVDAINHRKQP